MFGDIESMEKAAESAAEVVVGKSKDGQNVGFFILGLNSQAYMKAKREIEIEQIKFVASHRADTGGPIDLATHGGAVVAKEQQERFRAMILDACVVDWFGFSVAGQPAPFTKENLERVLKSFPSLRDRLHAEIEKEDAFL